VAGSRTSPSRSYAVPRPEIGALILGRPEPSSWACRKTRALARHPPLARPRGSTWLTMRATGLFAPARPSQVAAIFT